jgi:hypothetical protein
LLVQGLLLVLAAASLAGKHVAGYVWLQLLVEFTGVLICWLEFISTIAINFQLLPLLPSSSAGLQEDLFLCHCWFLVLLADAFIDC